MYCANRLQCPSIQLYLGSSGSTAMGAGAGWTQQKILDTTITHFPFKQGRSYRKFSLKF